MFENVFENASNYRVPLQPDAALGHNLENNKSMYFTNVLFYHFHLQFTIIFWLGNNLQRTNLIFEEEK